MVTYYNSYVLRTYESVLTADAEEYCWFYKKNNDAVIQLLKNVKLIFAASVDTEKQWISGSMWDCICLRTTEQLFVHQFTFRKFYKKVAYITKISCNKLLNAANYYYCKMLKLFADGLNLCICVSVWGWCLLLQLVFQLVSGGNSSDVTSLTSILSTTQYWHYVECGWSCNLNS